MQLSDAYLRFLAFSKKISATEIKKLWRRLFFCAFFTCIFYLAIFFNFGINAIIYKIILTVCWIPLFFVTLKTVPLSKLQHFFILSVVAIWTLFIHSIAAVFDVIFLEFIGKNIFIFHAVICLAIFLIFLPLEKKYFKSLLPQKNFFDNQPYGKYIIIMPLIIVSGVLILWIDNELIHSWQERISRIFLPFTFFFFYKYILTANRQIFENQQTIRYNQHLKAQISRLEQYNLLMQKSQEQLKILRHDMRHSYKIIFAMLQEGKISAVLDYIKVQENLLDLTAVKFYCHSPLINAALSIYLQLAENAGIKISHKINLPEKILIDENDLAILISNLLENAINASKKQNSDRREISITIQHFENQCALEITNLFDGEIIFENNLPKNFSEGHGIGMLSLKNFVEKYSAQFDFSHSQGEVKILIYFENI